MEEERGQTSCRTAAWSSVATYTTRVRFATPTASMMTGDSKLSLSMYLGVIANPNASKGMRARTLINKEMHGH